MSWAHGIVNGREVGYSVEATCDHPECDAQIDRGLGYVCGNIPGDGLGCGNFFCESHLHFTNRDEPRQACLACMKRLELVCNCNPAERTYGDHDPSCPEWEPECTCYEMICNCNPANRAVVPS